jgi:hypothetical protein
MRGSNPRLLAHKTNTLPTELMERLRQWCIGNIEASQALAPGSTPGWRISFFFPFFLGCVIFLNFFLKFIFVFFSTTKKAPEVRLELTTYRLTAGRATDCAIQEHWGWFVGLNKKTKNKNKTNLRKKNKKKKKATPTRFELARAEPIGFQNQLLNHSDTVPHRKRLLWPNG